MLKENEKSLANFQKGVDALFSALFWLLSYWLRFNFLSGAEQGLAYVFLLLAPVVSILTIYFFHSCGLYQSQRFSSRYIELLSVAKGSFLATTSLVVIIYFVSPERISRLTILFYFLISTFGMSIIRILIRNFLRSLRRKGQNLRHVILVGNSELLSQYIKTAQYYKDSGIIFVAWLDQGELEHTENIKSANLEAYEEIKNQYDIDRVVVSYQGKESYKTSLFVEKYFNDLIDIQILPDISYSLIGHNIEDFGGVPVLSVNKFDAGVIELSLKRLMDIFGASIGLIFLAPLFLVISLCVKLSSRGPIFFGQERVGVDGRLFKMWKFRSMKIATQGEDLTEWSNKENPRKTKVGDFLRRTSLDELPQLWNVLWGQMSLIGPRPERPHFVEKFRHEIPGYMLRHKMRAGITGWAQVNGWRGDTSLLKRIECDIYYIKNWSIFFDIKILFLTFFKGFINKNAY